jgi:uncharacterized membrane protein
MTARDAGRWALGLFLLAAGTGHLVAPEAFLAQTPTWLPWRPAIVLVSGLVELLLGAALLVVRRRRRVLGWVVAAFFVAILPGNLHQAISGTDAFGLTTPTGGGSASPSSRCSSCGRCGRPALASARTAGTAAVADRSVTPADRRSDGRGSS